MEGKNARDIHVAKRNLNALFKTGSHWRPDVLAGALVQKP